MFWFKKKSDKCSESALKLAVLSTKISLLLTIITVWVDQGPDSPAYAEVIFKGAFSFFLLAMACFFILLLNYISKKSK